MRVGCVPETGLYHEVLGAPTAQRDPALPHPILWIHGGGATGACFRTDLRGGPGWADRMAAGGAECWVTDWPGGGRSGGRNPLDITYDDVVAGYRHLLREVIGRPAVVVCHSMGGAVTWQLVEHEPDLVAGVVSLAGAYPANTPPTCEVESDDGRTVVATFGDTGVRFVVDRLAMYLYEDAYVYDQAIATSRHFDRGLVPALRASFVGLPPKMLLQRIGFLPGMPRVEDPSGFRDKPVRLVAGTEDPAHRRDLEERTVDLLRSWGAAAELVWLADRGLDGNGHFLFWEDNQDEVYEVVVDLVREVSAA